MLKVMREKAGSWFIKVVLGAIVVVFIFWGVGSIDSKKMSQAAVVNDDVITVEEYRESYNRMIEQYRRQFGDRLNADLIKTMGIERQALDGLIERTLMRQEAERLNFTVSDQELSDAIRAMPVFQEDGVFSAKLYQRVLELNRLTPENFEALQRQSMVIDQLRRFLMQGVTVSEPEVREWFEWNNARVSVDYVRFEPQTYADIQVSDEDVKAYYEANKAKYPREKMVKAQYVVFKTDDYLADVSATDDEVATYYKEHPGEFTEEKKVQARHILLRVAENAPPEEVEARRVKIEDILNQARKGKDFAELAKEYSEDSSKESGGDLGTFGEKTMVKPFADKAFSMAAGEISDPVRTQFGWHLIKVEKVIDAKTFTLEESKEKILDKLKRERAKVLAYDAAEKFSDQVSDGVDLKDVPLPPGLVVKETDFFKKTGPKDREIRYPGRFATAAFDLREKQISAIQDFNGDYYVIQPTGTDPERISTLEEATAQARSDVLRSRQEAKAMADAADLLTKVGSGVSLADAATAAGKEMKTTEPFKRLGGDKDIGADPEIYKAAFGLSPEKPLVSAPVQGKENVYVLRFKERLAADPAGFDAERQSIKDRLKRQKQSQLMEQWMAQKKQASRITIQDGLIPG